MSSWLVKMAKVVAKLGRAVSRLPDLAKRMLFRSISFICSELRFPDNPVIFLLMRKMLNRIWFCLAIVLLSFYTIACPWWWNLSIITRFINILCNNLMLSLHMKSSFGLLLKFIYFYCVLLNVYEAIVKLTSTLVSKDGTSLFFCKLQL